MLAREQLPAKRFLAISLGVIAVLFVVIVILILRLERLRSAGADAGESVLPDLAEGDQSALKQLRVFGTILGDHGWEVHWSPAVRYEQEGVVHLQRGSFHSELPGPNGERERIGLDALTFGEDGPLPLAEGFPLGHWRDLHPLQTFDEGAASFTWVVSHSARTFFIFYQYDDVLRSELPERFEEFLRGDSRQHAAFRRELSAADEARKRTVKAIKTIQEELLKVGLYEGEIDGLNGWRTKKALQRFLREEGYYGGKIDGVFGNRTLGALDAFRAAAQLEGGDAMDPELASAIVARLSPAPSDEGEANDSGKDDSITP